MNIIEFFNTVGYYTVKFKEQNKELNKATTFEGAVLGYLGQITN